MKIYLPLKLNVLAHILGGEERTVNYADCQRFKITYSHSLANILCLLLLNLDIGVQTSSVHTFQPIYRSAVSLVIIIQGEYSQIYRLLSYPVKSLKLCNSLGIKLLHTNKF